MYTYIYEYVCMYVHIYIHTFFELTNTMTLFIVYLWTYLLFTTFLSNRFALLKPGFLLLKNYFYQFM